MSPTGRWTSTPSSASRRFRSAGHGTQRDLVKIAPTAHDLAGGLYEYHLDFPGDALDPGCDYEKLGPPRLRGARPDGLRACRDRSGACRPARAAVLALLRLQRLEQPARRRLGDDPARLRRRQRRRGARAAADNGRLQPARGSRAGGLGRRQAPPRRRHPSRRVPGGRLARELLRRRRCSSAARPPRASAATTRPVPTTTFARRSRRSRAIRARLARSFPGSTSRAAGASFSRPSSTARRGQT